MSGKAVLSMIFYNGQIHTMETEDSLFYGFEVAEGKVTRLFRYPKELPANRKELKNLDGMHVYPAFICFTAEVPEKGDREAYERFCSSRGIGLVCVSDSLTMKEELYPEVKTNIACMPGISGADPLSAACELVKNGTTERFKIMASFTKDAAAFLGEDKTRGTLAPGKRADFFTVPMDWNGVTKENVNAFLPVRTYIGGNALGKKERSFAEKLRSFFG